MHTAHERLSILAEASGALFASLSLDDILPAVGGLAERLMPADAYALWRLDPDTLIWRVVWQRNLPDALVTSIAGQRDDGALLPAPLFVSNTGAEALLGGRLALYGSYGIRSLAIIPLRMEGRTHGTVVAYYFEPKTFTDTDRMVSTALGNLGSAALRTAVLYDELSQANRLKDDFLATLSHELRTPLNAVLGYTRMIRTGALPAGKQGRALETIERNAGALTQLVEDVLDVSRIQAGKIRLDVEPVNLADVIAAAFDTVTPAAEARGVRLERHVDADVPSVPGDPDRLQQVVWNLLANAVKFSPAETRVDVWLRQTGASVELVVADTGIGLPPDFLPHIFERFRQGDSRFSREHGGLGLGLAITRHLVEMHGGTIEAASPGPGQGTTFTVRLPVRAGRAPGGPPRALDLRMSARAHGNGLSDLSGIRVLAVDDDADALALLREVLETAGAQVRTARSAVEALETLTTTTPHVLVSDIGMPGMDGLAFIEEVRRLPDAARRGTPAAALTAYARSDDRARALASGFQVYLSKPIDPAELAAAVLALAAASPAHT